MNTQCPFLTNDLACYSKGTTHSAPFKLLILVDIKWHRPDQRTGLTDPIKRSLRMELKAKRDLIFPFLLSGIY